MKENFRRVLWLLYGMGQKGWKQKTVQKDMDVLKRGSIMAWSRRAAERQVGMPGLRIHFEGRAAQPHGGKNGNHTNHKETHRR